VAQNLAPGFTGEAHRGQLGPEPGADSRRPQWGQKGRGPSTFVPQNGQFVAPPPGEGAAARAGADDTRVSATGDARPAAAAAAARRAPELLSGFPQSWQNSAPASFSRPQ